jgi:hypothetical protein
VSKLRVIGMDPSLRNWGVATGYLDLETMEVTIDGLHVIRAVLPKGKQIRKNSLDLESAYQISKEALELSQGADVVFVEIPEGTQSARAMASYGICIGILGVFRATGIPFYEVTPLEVKVNATGCKTASKVDMIAWATNRHPEAPWPTRKSKGITVVIEGKAEHMADAAAAIHAGIASNPFQQVKRFLKPN